MNFYIFNIFLTKYVVEQHNLDNNCFIAILLCDNVLP